MTPVFALLLVVALPSPPIASLVAISSVVILSLFSGFPVLRTRLPDAYIWGPYVSPLHYAYDGLSLNELYGQQFNCTPNQLLPPSAAPITSTPYPVGFSGAQLCPFTSGSQFLASQALSTHWWYRWGDLAVLIGIWAILTILCMLCFSYIRFEPRRAQSRKNGGAQTLSNDENIDPRVPSPVRTDSAGAVLAWRDVSCYVDRGHQILKAVSGFVLPGTFLAVMGESGAA